jgi:hypothetical protein
MLRLSLYPDAGSVDLPLRKGRAIGWFEDALSPLLAQLTQPEVHRLAVAIRSAVGIEALVWLTDIAGLSRDEATELMQWSGWRCCTRRSPRMRGEREPCGRRTTGLQVPMRSCDAVVRCGRDRCVGPSLGRI